MLITIFFSCLISIYVTICIYRYLPLHQTQKENKTCTASKMWNQIPSDILSKIFSFLPADSIACAASVCNQWNKCSKTSVSVGTNFQPPWFLAMHARRRGHACYAHNPVINRWYTIPLDFVPVQVRPVTSIGSFILYRSSVPSPIQFSLCNLFTKQYRVLPPLIASRTNPAVGIVEMNTGRGTHRIFRIYVVGGMKENGMYESTVEIYDSSVGKWNIIGLIPREFTIRLTIWTSNESVYCKGVLYWITAARAFSVMGYELCSGTWKELNVPVTNQLIFAVLVPRKGTLLLIGAMGRGEACIWELGLNDKWILIERVPSEFGDRFLGSKGSWNSVQCVGTDEGFYLYRELGSEMLVWKEVSNKVKWEWLSVEGFRSSSIRGEQRPNMYPIKGLLFHPTLNPSVFVL